MFSTCRSLQTGLILLALVACSKEPPAAAPPSAPLVAATPQSQGTAATDASTLSSQLNAAGIPATYEATFGAEQQLRIAEQRGDSRNGEYEFRGARLLRYSGSGLASAAPVELRFDMNGVMTLSKSGAGPAPAEEVSAIRERAQLLRSHALAQRTTRDHR